MVMTQQIEGYLGSITGSITTGGTPQLVMGATELAQLLALGASNQTIQGVTIMTNSAVGLYFGWTSSVSATQYRRKQTSSMDGFEWSISTDALKNLYVVGATAGETFEVQLMQ